MKYLLGRFVGGFDGADRAITEPHAVLSDLCGEPVAAEDHVAPLRQRDGVISVMATPSGTLSSLPGAGRLEGIDDAPDRLADEQLSLLDEERGHPSKPPPPRCHPWA